LPPLSFPVQSTLDNSWLALAGSTYRSTILSGRDLPLGMVQAAGINRLTARSPGGATPVTGQELWRQCNRVILETHGKLSLYNSVGAQVSGQEAKGFSDIESANLIIFDLQKEPPAPGRNSFYIQSTNPYAVVVLRNGSSLAGDLSVISPHPIIIEGGFNNQRRAVSLVSGATVIGVQTPANSPPGQQGGTALLMPERGLWLRLARLLNRSLPAGEAALLLSSRSVEAQMPGFLGNFWGKFIPSLLGNGLERLGGAFSFSEE
jgi:hypothetical protein